MCQPESYHIRKVGCHVLFLLVALLSGSSFAQEYTDSGPYEVAAYTKPVDTVLNPVKLGSVQLKAAVTYPASQAGSFPLVAFFSGLECKASWYAPIVQHLASWGYVVLQYTAGAVSGDIPNERQESKYLQPLLDWLAGEAANTSNPLAGRVNFERKALMGHGRGGKLASLHYADRTDVATAVLLDPVDCAVNGTGHPSAVAALAGLRVTCGESMPPHGRSNKRAVVIGASVVDPVNPCNPRGTNYASFTDALAPGSWQILIRKAGHMQFASSNDMSYRNLKNACGTSTASTEEVISTARTIATAWLESTFRLEKSTDRLQSFGSWLMARESANALNFKLLAAQRSAAARAILPATTSSS